MTLWRDIRYAVRVLVRARGFTALAVAILTLGICATTTIFSLFDAALLRPLPYRDPDAVMMLWEAPPKATHNRVAPLNYVDWSEQNRTFSAMAAVAGGSQTLTRPGVLPEPSRSAARAPGWCANCSPRVSCCRSPAAPLQSLSRSHCSG